jgi:CheY-like chemotaxis protein
MAGLLQRSLGPTVELVADFPRSLPPAFTDANQLETALLNLAVNARDAMPDGGTITIEAAAVTFGAQSAVGLPPGDYLRLSVTDDGAGMDPPTLARATEPFYTTKGIGKGTGLGLSMVHGLAEQSGGRLVLESATGKGTRVEIWLPQAQAVGAVRPRPSRDGDDQRVRPLVILAVDDDSLVLVNTAAMLEDLGHEVVVAASAAEALAILRGRRVDLVITDHAMPQMTGQQLAEQLKVMRPGLPVVLASGFAELPEGLTGQLPRLAKPYSQAELARMLRQMFPATEAAVA